MNTIENLVRRPRFNKLIDATNSEGKKDEKVFEITKRIEQDLLQFPEFIGVAPFGSRTKGYSDEYLSEPKTWLKGSDCDVYIFEDWKKMDDERVFDKLCKIGLEYRKKGIKIEILEQFLSMKDLSDLFEVADSVGTEYLHVQRFANLCRPGRGKKMNEWRSLVKNEISKSPKEKQEILFQLFSNFLVWSDKLSLVKMGKRIPNFDADLYANSRKKLWEKRVQKIYSE